MDLRRSALVKMLLIFIFAFLLLIPCSSDAELTAAFSNDTSSSNLATPADTLPSTTSFPKGEEATTEPSLSKEKSSSQQTSSQMSLSGPGGGGVGSVINLPTMTTSVFTGSLAFNIPIEVPPGRGGIAPNLALSYRNSQKNGWIGVGWELDMGAIQRGTKFGVSYPANLPGTDFVTIVNGAATELVPRGDWGTNYFGAKIEGRFSKYYYNSTTGGWEVTAKNGTKYYYGTTSLSRQDSAIGTFKWCLDKVQDTNNNYMTISYFKDNGEIYLDRIDYTGNSNSPALLPTNYVKFWHDDGSRPDAPDMYVPNFLVQTRYLLKTIEVNATNGNPVRAYKLVYTNTNSGNARPNRSILTTVQQYDSDARVNSGDITGGNWLTIFNGQYDTGGTDPGLDTPPANPAALPATIPNTIYYTYSDYNFQSPLHKMRIGDFNGDGIMDYMWIPANGDGRWLIAYGSPTGFIIPNYNNPALRYTLSGNPNDYSTLPANNSQMGFGDFNRDGKTDYMWIPANGDGRWLIAYGTDTGFVIPDYNNPALPATIPDTNYPYTNYYTHPVNEDQIRFGDFNGDGNTDYMWIPANGDGRWLIAYGTGTGLVIPDYNNPALPNVISGHYNRSTTGLYHITADFNGDGRTDYMWIPIYGDGRWLIAYGSDTGFVLPDYNNPALPAGLPDSGKYTHVQDGSTLRLGDFNGDGKTDFMWVPANGDGRWLIAYGTGYGNGFTIPDYNNPALLSTISGNPDDYPTRNTYNGVWNITGDFNGDGKTDYMWLPDASDGWLIAYSTGSGFVIPAPYALPVVLPSGYYSIDYSYPYSIHTLTGDFNGDGKTDYMWIPENGDGRWLVAYANMPEHLPEVLTTATNAIGGSSTIAYIPSTHFTNTLLPFPVQVVQSITTNDVRYDGYGNNNSITLYDYHYGLYDIPERDFRGFGFVRQTNPDFTSVENDFLQSSIYKGLLDTQIISDAGGHFYTITHNTYQATSPYTGCNFPYLTLTRSEIYDGTQTSKAYATSFTYDDYGNVTTKYNFGDTSISSDEKNETITYNYDTVYWIVSLPSLTQLKDGNGNIKAQSLYFYNSGTVNLATKYDFVNSSTLLTTSVGYNTYGNQTSITDPNGNVTTTAYDSTYTYPASVTNQYFGFTVSKTYDYRYGKVWTDTDFNNNTTTYYYDAFGRLSKIVNPYDTSSPYGTQSIYYLNFGQGVGSQKIVTYNTEQSNTSNVIGKETYFDGFGRAINTRTEGPDSKVINTGTIYNQMGRVSYSSLPYFEGLEVAKWISYFYDPVGRIIETLRPDGTYTTSSYAVGTTNYVLETTVLIDANFHKKEEDRDAYGRLKQVREYTGVSPNFTLYATTSYGYNVADNLVNVMDASGNVTSINYDWLGRKTDMIDSDMGYWQYSYDGNGNLRFQTDAKNQTIEFQYDALNRVTLKNYPTGTDTVYTYDEGFTPNYRGRLTTVSNASGTTKFYYDMLGRTTKTVKTVDSTAYTTETVYDALGRVTSVIYPDAGRETVNYTYNGGGNLWQVVGYATYTDYTAAGQPGTITYVNNVVSNYTYDPNTLRLKTIQTTGPGGGGSGYTVAPVSYNWVTANTPTGVTGDDQYAGVSLPFNFNFYGTNYSTAYVSSNGFLSFGSGSGDYTPDPIPSTNLPNTLAAGLWRDLYPPAGGCTNNACITYGSTSGQFAVSYNNVRNYANASRQTFQILLNSDGSIVYQYAGVTNDVSTRVGIENQTGTQGTAYGSPGNGLAIKFTPATARTVLQDLRYDYYDNGNIWTITDNLEGNRTQTFTYDDLNRLTQAQSSSYGTITYQYNEIGNMTFNSQGVGNGNYVYNDPAHRHAVTNVGGSNTYVYDANGNMTNKNGTTIVYDYDNRPISIGSNTFVYDYTGQRVKKNTTVYIGNIYECNGSTCTKYIFAGGQRIALKTGSTVKHYHTDHLSSTNIVTNDSGAKEEEIYYYPYGASRTDSNPAIARHKYTGQEGDGETGLYYYGARYYDPSIGRFISADTIVPGPANPQALNRYSYVLNNPLLYTDPTGHFSLDSFLKSVFTGAVFGGVFWLTDNPVLAGVAAGAVAGGLSGGGVEGIVVGAAFGGSLGGLGGGVNATWAYGGYVMLGAGAVASTATGGLDGLAYYAGAIAGAHAAGYAMADYSEVGGTSGTTGRKARDPRLISEKIGGVQIRYTKPGAKNPVDSVLADRFEEAVGLTKLDNPDLNSLHISATTNGHKPPSLHVEGFALDISRVNGIRMGGGYGQNSTVTTVVNSLQTNLGEVGAYENFGPYMMNGPRPPTDALIQQHSNHIHYSIKP